MKRIYQALTPFDVTDTSMVIKSFFLFPEKPGVIWDVGCGPGKVLIESKLRYKDVTLIGIERNVDYPPLMRANMARHGLQADDIQIVERDAVFDEFEDLPRPDAIYMSCAGQAEENIIPKFWEYLKPGGVICCNMSKQPDWIARIIEAQQVYGGELNDYVYYYDKNALWQPAYIKAEVLHWAATKPAE